jgi:hypothetical protein
MMMEWIVDYCLARRRSGRRSGGYVSPPAASKLHPPSTTSPSIALKQTHGEYSMLMQSIEMQQLLSTLNQEEQAFVEVLREIYDGTIKEPLSIKR